MMRTIAVIIAALLTQVLVAEDFQKIPSKWKWLNDNEVAFSYDGSYTDSAAFSVNARNGRKNEGIKAPEKFSAFPINPEGAVNLTYSPDSTMLAFTRANDLYVADVVSGEEKRLTFDGNDLILNGYASWVYYEEIFGRASNYRAFWWSPDSRKIAFYRFDNSQVPLFPIYSPFGQDGKLLETRYPKAGERNPEVRIGLIDLTTSTGNVADTSRVNNIVWADFDPEEDQYFGILFWGADSRDFYVSRMPRVQNTLDLYAVSAADGSKQHIYNERYKTWIDWMQGVIFTSEGLYMARSFETDWEQIYFLSYDGRTFRRLTEGQNWRISLLKVDEKKGDVYFTAERDSRIASALYKLDKKGVISALTAAEYNVSNVSISPDSRHFVAALSNQLTPTKVILGSTSRGISVGQQIIADMATETYSPEKYALPQLVELTTTDGFVLPALITYPKDFDASKKYPVHVDIYGGPDTPMVRGRWRTPDENNQWWSENGIIQVVADCRAAGHNGRAGLDMVYRNLTEVPVKDFIAWADYLKSLPYVDADKIGVEGFSFGGTMTTMLLFTASDSYHFGIAGGGVYDWMLYDSHYTERYMDTPERNPEGYAATNVMKYAGSYLVDYEYYRNDSKKVMLKLTHGTGDDNVHFQNTLQLIDVLQKEGKIFEFMIYPDGMHGYRGYQGRHFNEENRAFWLRHLK